MAPPHFSLDGDLRMTDREERKIQQQPRLFKQIGFCIEDETQVRNKYQGSIKKPSTLSIGCDSMTMTDADELAAGGRGSLPIIDISPFLETSGSAKSARARDTTAAAINKACHNYGFFYLEGHGIPIETLDKVVSLARDFFALPLDEKNKIKRFDAGGPEGGDGARGYQGLGENITGGLQDMQEAIDWYREWPASKKQAGNGSVQTLQGPNLWPEQPSELKAVYLSYIEDVKAVGKALVRAMGQALNLPPPLPNADKSTEDADVFVRNTDETFWVMRMIGYPPLTTPLPSTTNDDTSVTQYSCGEHTDYGCVTLLLSDATPGALQVQHKDGSWVNANPIRGAFVVNIGDMIERWTNGLWKSTMHRVIHRGEEQRISVPFFYEPEFDAVVKPLRKCVVESGVKEVHGGSTYGEHLLTKVFNNFYYSKRTDW